MRDRSLCKIVEKSVSLYGVHITRNVDIHEELAKYV